MRDTLFSVTRSLLPCYPVTVLGFPKKAIRERWEEASLLSLLPSHRAWYSFFFFLPASLRHKEASGEERGSVDSALDTYVAQAD